MLFNNDLEQFSSTTHTHTQIYINNPLFIIYFVCREFSINFPSCFRILLISQFFFVFFFPAPFQHNSFFFWRWDPCFMCVCVIIFILQLFIIFFLQNKNKKNSRFFISTFSLWSFLSSRFLRASFPPPNRRSSPRDLWGQLKVLWLNLYLIGFFHWGFFFIFFLFSVARERDSINDDDELNEWNVLSISKNQQASNNNNMRNAKESIAKVVNSLFSTKK